MDNLDENDYSAIFERAYAYNKALYETNYPLMDYKNVPGYYDTLCITDNDMIGYLKIARIGVELPIYHGTSDEVLNRGVGHLEGSSLPIGGENTHSIMSAHRGLPSSKLFTCTPYGINTHRLLVRGVRIETIEAKPIIYVSNEAFRVKPLIVTPAVAAPILLIFLIHLLVKYREPTKDTQQKKKEDGKDRITLTKRNE